VAAAALAEPILRAKGFVHSAAGPLLQAVRARGGGRWAGRHEREASTRTGLHRLPSQSRNVARMLAERTGADWI
jgi:cobalamin biosynthesis protein CobW